MCTPDQARNHIEQVEASLSFIANPMVGKRDDVRSHAYRIEVALGDLPRELKSFAVSKILETITFMRESGGIPRSKRTSVHYIEKCARRITNPDEYL